MSKAIRVATLSGAGLDLTFSNVEDESAPFQAYLTDLAGFYGGVGVKDDGSQRTLGHGFFAVPSLRTGRELTLSGTITFDTEQNRLLADRFLSGVLWDGEFGTLTVQTDDLSLTSTVKLGGEIKHSYVGQTALEVQIPLTAPDPFLYAPARVSQVFPAGAGQGLVYPLFTTKGVAVGSELLTFTATALSSTKTSEVYQGAPVYARTAGYVFPKITATPGRSYQFTVAHKASKAGSGTALLASIQSSTGSAQITKYFGVTSGSVFENGTEWKTDTVTLVVPAGYDTIQLAVFANHTNYAVQDATHYFTFSVKESTPVLDWGQGAPLSAALGNEGNATAYPTITVRGSWPAGFSIVESGRTITYSSAVVASTPVVIDTRIGSVSVGGVDQTYKLTSRDWFKVPAGSSFQPRITALAPSNGWADISLSSTYI